MPAHLKASDRRQHQRPRSQPAMTVVVGTIQREIPPVPRGLLKPIREQWCNYWESDVAQAALVETDLPTVRRLFTLYDERERAYQAYRKARVVKGSTGQPVINPAWKQVPVMDSEIRQLEDRLGLTPKARVQLGIALPATRKAEYNAEDARIAAGRALLERWTAAKERLANVAASDRPWCRRETS